MRCRAGDLIFYKVTPQSGWVARLIAILQLLRKEGTAPINYSHVALAEDCDILVEARWPRVRRGPIDWDNPLIEVWRVDNDSAETAIGVVSFAKEHLGDWYGFWELFLGFLPDRHASICTTFVARAWQSAGYDLTTGSGRIVAPNELVNSGLLAQIDQGVI